MRQPPPVPPRRKVPVGVTVNDYNTRRAANLDDDSDNVVVVAGGGGGGLNAARQISSSHDPNLTHGKKNLQRGNSFHDYEKSNTPDSVIGAGVDIKGTMAFKR